MRLRFSLNSYIAYRPVCAPLDKPCYRIPFLPSNGTGWQWLKRIYVYRRNSDFNQVSQTRAGDINSLPMTGQIFVAEAVFSYCSTATLNPDQFYVYYNLIQAVASQVKCVSLANKVNVKAQNTFISSANQDKAQHQLVLVTDTTVL